MWPLCLRLLHGCDQTWKADSKEDARAEICLVCELADA